MGFDPALLVLGLGNALVEGNIHPRHVLPKEIDAVHPPLGGHRLSLVKKGDPRNLCPVPLARTPTHPKSRTPSNRRTIGEVLFEIIKHSPQIVLFAKSLRSSCIRIPSKDKLHIAAYMDCWHSLAPPP